MCQWTSHTVFFYQNSESELKINYQSCTVHVFHIIKLASLPSSSETSKISSTVSGKLIRCFSVVICEEQREVVRERYDRSKTERKERTTNGKCWVILRAGEQAGPDQDEIIWLNIWVMLCQGYYNHVKQAWCVAHRRDRLLGNQFQHINDRDVTQPLSNTQRRCPILYRERWETSCKLFLYILNC